eukprot:UN26075
MHRSIYIHELILGKNVATCLQILNLGTLLLDMGKVKKALELYEEAKKLLEGHLGRDHFRIGDCEHFIALRHGAKGTLDVAYKHECRANEIFKKNKLNPSKFWRRKLRPPNTDDISSSESEGSSILHQSETLLQWFCEYDLKFQGRLGSFTLITRLNEMRRQRRARHKPILRSSPEYK